MNIFVLSELRPSNVHVGWSVNRSLEATLAATCKATFLYPTRRSNHDVLACHYPSDPLGDSRVDVLQRYRQRVFKSWYQLDQLPTLGTGPNILLLIGVQQGFLLSMFALKGLLDQFDLRVGYLLDGFAPRQLNQLPLKKLDHLFVMSADLATETHQTHGISTSFLPIGIDTAKFGGYRQQRSIDILSYGRTDDALHRHLAQHYNQPDCDRLYLHSTFRHPHIDQPTQHMALLVKLLKRSKINLCFESVNKARFQGGSPLLYRWLEGWAAGCMIVGKKPTGQGVSALMDWPNSTIELPDHAPDWLPFLEALLNDEGRWADVSWRNYWECLQRHDWRYRLRDLFDCLGLPIPLRLQEEIARLHQLQPGSTNPLATPLRVGHDHALEGDRPLNQDGSFPNLLATDRTLSGGHRAN
jgi:hypothetical protein